MAGAPSASAMAGEVCESGDAIVNGRSESRNVDGMMHVLEGAGVRSRLGLLWWGMGLGWASVSNRGVVLFY